MLNSKGSSILQISFQRGSTHFTHIYHACCLFLATFHLSSFVFHCVVRLANSSLPHPNARAINKNKSSCRQSAKGWRPGFPMDSLAASAAAVARVCCLLQFAACLLQFLIESKPSTLMRPAGASPDTPGTRRPLLAEISRLGHNHYQLCVCVCVRV